MAAVFFINISTILCYAAGMETWPYQLQRVKPLAENFRFGKGQAKIETQFDSGKTFTKKSNQLTPDRFSFVLRFTESQLQVFTDFYDNTLDKGTKEFYWRHPIDDRLIRCKFIGDYTGATQVSSVTWDLALSLEVIE